MKCFSETPPSLSRSVNKVGWLRKRLATTCRPPPRSLGRLRRPRLRGGGRRLGMGLVLAVQPPSPTETSSVGSLLTFRGNVTGMLFSSCGAAEACTVAEFFAQALEILPHGAAITQGDAGLASRGRCALDGRLAGAKQVRIAAAGAYRPRVLPARPTRCSARRTRRCPSRSCPPCCRRVPSCPCRPYSSARHPRLTKSSPALPNWKLGQIKLQGNLSAFCPSQRLTTRTASFISSKDPRCSRFWA